MSDETPSDAPPAPLLARALAALLHEAPLIAGILLAVPTLLAFNPPMNDLPMHEGVVGILARMGDDSFFPHGLYEINLGHPNQLFYYFAWLFTFVATPAVACKIVVAGSQVATLWAAARFADHLGRSRWGAMLVAPLALGFTYWWGLVTNLLGFAAFLFVLPAIDEAARTPTARGMAKTCGLLVLVYLAHESLYVAAVGVLIALSILLPLSWKATSLRLAPAVLAIGLAAGHQVWAARFFTGVIKQSSPTRFLPLEEKLRFLPTVLFGSHDLAPQLMLLGLALAGALTLAAARRSEAPPEDDDDAEGLVYPATAVGRLQARCHRHRFELLGVVFVFMYFVVPFSWRGATLLHERFLGPGWALLVICAAPRGVVRIVPKLAAAVLSFGIMLLSWPQFVDGSATFRDLDALIGRIPRGSAVASCSFKRHYVASRIFSPSVGPARSVSVIGGRSSLTLTISPISPVLIPPAYRWDEVETRHQRGPIGVIPAHDLRWYGFFLVQADEGRSQALMVGALAPDADLVEARGEWMLFRSKHVIEPILAPPPPPPPRYESLQARLDFLALQDERN